MPEFLTDQEIAARDLADAARDQKSRGGNTPPDLDAQRAVERRLYDENWRKAQTNQNNRPGEFGGPAARSDAVFGVQRIGETLPVPRPGSVEARLMLLEQQVAALTTQLNDLTK